GNNEGRFAVEPPRGATLCIWALRITRSAMTDWIPGNINDRSITGFRIRHGSPHGPMSKRFYYEMKEEGTGPREIVLANKKIIIRVREEKAGEDARATPTTTEQGLRAKAGAARKAKAMRGAEASVKGPRHVSKQGKRKRTSHPPQPEGSR